MYFGVGSFFGGVWYWYIINNVDVVIVFFGVCYGVFCFGYSFDFMFNSLMLGNIGGIYEFFFMINFEDSKEV